MTEETLEEFYARMKTQLDWIQTEIHGMWADLAFLEAQITVMKDPHE